MSISFFLSSRLSPTGEGGCIQAIAAVIQMQAREGYLKPHVRMINRRGRFPWHCNLNCLLVITSPRSDQLSIVFPNSTILIGPGFVVYPEASDPKHQIVLKTVTRTIRYLYRIQIRQKSGDIRAVGFRWAIGKFCYDYRIM